jgi:hypothetical protein
LSNPTVLTHKAINALVSVIPNILELGSKVTSFEKEEKRMRKGSERIRQEAGLQIGNRKTDLPGMAISS